MYFVRIGHGQGTPFITLDINQATRFPNTPEFKKRFIEMGYVPKGETYIDFIPVEK